MGRSPHEQTMIWVRVDVDESISQMVKDLNEISDVRTHSSCQGTIGEGGPHPYRAYVMCSWACDSALAVLKSRYIVRPQGNGSWGYVHPLGTEGQSDGVQDESEDVEQATDGRQVAEEKK